MDENIFDRATSPNLARETCSLGEVLTEVVNSKWSYTYVIFIYNPFCSGRSKPSSR